MGWTIHPLIDFFWHFIRKLSNMYQHREKSVINIQCPSHPQPLSALTNDQRPLSTPACHVQRSWGRSGSMCSRLCHQSAAGERSWQPQAAPTELRSLKAWVSAIRTPLRWCFGCVTSHQKALSQPRSALHYQKVTQSLQVKQGEEARVTHGVWIRSDAGV